MEQIKLYGAQWCPDCRRTKDFFDQQGIQYEYINVDLSQEASAEVEQINNGKRIIPTIKIDNASYTNPQNHELRKVLGLNPQGKIVLYGADWCGDCRRAKRFLNDNEINFVFIDVDQNTEAASYVEKVNNGKRIIPTILINEKVYTNPDNPTLRAALSLNQVSQKRIYDVIIIGAGAAGLTTSIYAQRDKFDTIILEKKNIGGNAFITKTIENYPGFKSVSGPDLMEKMAEQAIVLGAEIKTGIEVLEVEKLNRHFTVSTNDGEIFGKSIVIASGSTYKTLGVDGESELIGSGVHFCATCDGAFYRNKKVIVVGGGNSALEEGMFLAGFCEHVTIVHRSEQFSATDTYVEKIKQFSNINTYLNTKIEAFIKNENGTFKGIKVSNKSTKDEQEIIADGVFVFIGLKPNTNAFSGLLNISSTGHLLTKGLNQTNVPGIFAAGDCRHGAIAQVAAATGEGVVASYGVRDYLTNNNG